MNRELLDPDAVGETTPSLAAASLRQSEEPPARYQVLDSEGSPVSDHVPDLSDAELRDLYRWMLVQQVVDDRMVKLQRRGEMGTYASGRGQEASIVGGAYALTDDDFLYPYGREAAAMLVHGVSMRDLLLYWRGVADSNRLEGSKTLPIAIAIGTHVPVGVGYAWGQRLAGEDDVTAMFMGEGHPSTGEVQAGMNFAGVVDAQAVFYCQNNQYTISLPFEEQTNARSVAQKAIAWGLDGIRVDGNDVLAVYDAMTRARKRALDGNPVIVEAVTYRIEAHTTNDDPGRYRESEEVDAWRPEDPVVRFRKFLEHRGLREGIDEEAMREEIHAEFDAAKEAADAYDPGGIDEMFEYVHEETPTEVQRQLEEFEAFLEERPDAYEFIEERPKG